jgi:hypothetical protein
VTDAAKTAGLPQDFADRIRGYQLRELGAVGSGRYELLNGNVPIWPNGKPLRIDLNAQYAPGTPGAAAGKNVATMPDPQDKAAFAEWARKQGQ